MGVGAGWARDEGVRCIVCKYMAVTASACCAAFLRNLNFLPNLFSTFVLQSVGSEDRQFDKRVLFSLLRCVFLLRVVCCNTLLGSWFICIGEFFSSVRESGMWVGKSLGVGERRARFTPEQE